MQRAPAADQGAARFELAQLYGTPHECPVIYLRQSVTSTIGTHHWRDNTFVYARRTIRCNVHWDSKKMWIGDMLSCNALAEGITVIITYYVFSLNSLNTVFQWRKERVSAWEFILPHLLFKRCYFSSKSYCRTFPKTLTSSLPVYLWIRLKNVKIKLFRNCCRDTTGSHWKK